MKIHLVFHISQLKPYKGEVIPANEVPARWITEDPVPERILDRCLKKVGRKGVVYVHVKWKGGEESEATWEKYYPFISKFPSFDIEDDADVKGRTCQVEGPEAQAHVLVN